MRNVACDRRGSKSSESDRASTSFQPKEAFAMLLQCFSHRFTSFHLLQLRVDDELKPRRPFLTKTALRKAPHVDLQRCSVPNEAVLVR